jgi:hypothetical protein
MAFPCPACFQPLLAMVEPDLDLECPVCRTTFKVPAPPLPVPRFKPPPVPKVMPDQTVAKPPGSIMFVLGLITLVVGTVCTFGFGLFLFSMIFVTGVIVARIKNGFLRRRYPMLPKLSWGAICWEGVRAIGITMTWGVVAGLSVGFLMNVVGTIWP